MCPRCVLIGVRPTRRNLRSGAASSHHTSLCEVFLPRVVAALAAMLLLVVGAHGRQPQSGGAPSSGAPARVIELRIGDEVDPISAEYVVGGIEQAAREHASLVLITMDTPGGLETSMQDIIQHILSSPVPVAVYVSPTGSRGASAGFFILLSADIAAMAPGTHTGAASPIMAVGGYPVTIDETLKKKILNDATAFLRSYSEKRNRNPTLAETAVTDGKAFTETEALNGKLIDLVAKSNDDLFAQLDGRTITRFDGSTMRLDLHNPQTTVIEMSLRQQFLARVVQPDVFFILLIAGVVGLYVEFTHPGMIAPGVIGAISLVLALFAMHLLPVNFAGLLLIVVALGFFLLEAKYTSHGVLALGGVIAMMLGALMLIRSPLTGAGVSLGVALGVTVPCAAVTILLMRLVLSSRAWKPAAGAEQLVGALAEVTEALEPEAEVPAGVLATAPNGSFQGMVRLRGELWRAVAAQPIPAGTHVRVLRTAGLTVYVSPVGEAANAQPPAFEHGKM